jgi:hypothetical protein
MKLSKINWELVGILIAIVVMFGSMYLLFTIPQPRQQIYNCSIAEISPDYPIAVKEGCRKLRADKIK